MRFAVRTFTLVCALSAAAASFASGTQENGFRYTDLVIGSGRSSTEGRSVASYTGIDLQGSGTVLLTMGSTRSISVSADDNLLELVRTDVVGNTLKLGFNQGARVRTVAPLVFRVTAPDIQELAISGSGDIKGQSVIRADRLSLSIGGSGSIQAAVAVEELSVSIRGSGSLDIKGSADTQEVRINGSVNYDGRDLRSANATIRVNGSGDSMVSVSRELDVNIAGSGNVTFSGSPKTTIRTSGSGTVRQY
ncbi:MAG: DUF2807 domain-containing protein [Acidobacteria bacterium]|nr:DUF2807 domain-containing protein [Acidobacteriota bacterium]